MALTTVYRFQPVGHELCGHLSATSNDELDCGPHVFASLSEATAVLGWCDQPGTWELIEISAEEKDVRDNGDYEGYVLVGGRGQIVRRTVLGRWENVISWAKEIQRRA